MAKPKSLNGQTFIAGKPKKTRQGNGKNSRPRHTRKMLRGQGK